MDLDSIAEEVVSRAETLFDAHVQDGVVNRPHLHVVVARREPIPNGFAARILASQSFGNIDGWVHDYAAIASGKLDISIRTGLPSRQVQALHPELLVIGDVKYGGSAVLGNIVVACSGVQSYYDEAFAYCIAWLIRAGIEDFWNHQRQDDSSDYFL